MRSFFSAESLDASDQGRARGQSCVHDCSEALVAQCTHSLVSLSWPNAITSTHSASDLPTFLTSFIHSSEFFWMKTCQPNSHTHKWSRKGPSLGLQGQCWALIVSPSLAGTDLMKCHFSPTTCVTASCPILCYVVDVSLCLAFRSVPEGGNDPLPSWQKWDLDTFICSTTQSWCI